MSRLTVLHTAELHLDAPFTGLGRTPPPIAAALRDASLAAWDALVDHALAHDVAALICAGGLCGGLEHGVRGQARLRDGLARLVAGGIAVAVALGHLNVGLFASDDAMRDRVMAAAKAEGERMWQLPLEDDYKDYLKSAFADIANVGGRWGGAVTAALFLKEFSEDTPWVHLDIPGTAWLDEPKPYMAKGPTGLPVRSLVRLAMEWK